MTFCQEVQLELIKAAFSVGLLLLTWFGGQRILNQWDTRKKRKELDIQAAIRFQELIGEWKAVWRAWKVLHAIPEPNQIR